MVHPILDAVVEYNALEKHSSPPFEMVEAICNLSLQTKVFRLVKLKGIDAVV